MSGIFGFNMTQANQARMIEKALRNLPLNIPYAKDLITSNASILSTRVNSSISINKKNFDEIDLKVWVEGESYNLIQVAKELHLNYNESLSYMLAEAYKKIH